MEKQPAKDIIIEKQATNPNYHMLVNARATCKIILLTEIKPTQYGKMLL